MLAKSTPGEEVVNLLTEMAAARHQVNEARQSGNENDALQRQVQLANLLLQTGEIEQANQLVSEVIARNKQDASMIQALIVRGDCEIHLGCLASAQEFYQQAVELSRLINDHLNLANAFLHLASHIHLTRGQFELGFRMVENARSLVVNLNEPWQGIFLLAKIYQMTRNSARLRRALDSLLPMVVPGTRSAGAYYLLWAQLTLDEEEVDKAEEYLHLVLRIASQTGDPNLNIYGRIEQSRFHRLKKNAPAGRAWAEDALFFARRLKLHYLEGIAGIELAQVEWACNNAADAEIKLGAAAQVLEPIGARFELARISLFQAAIKRQTGSPAADTCWNQAALQILDGNFIFLLECEREISFPIISANLRSRDPETRQTTERLAQGLSQVAPLPLRIFGLGQFTVWQGRRRIPDQTWQRRRAGELFRYLLLKHNHSAGREEILEDLWAEHFPDNAHDLFHQATSTLRHILEPDLPEKFPSRYLIVEGDRVFLILPPGSWIDYEQFEQTVTHSLSAPRIDILERALASYLDDLFPSDRYQDWNTARRESLAELRLQATLALGQAYLAVKNDLKVLECSRRALELDSWCEDAALLGMKACQNLNNIPQALRIYQQLEITLQSELGIKPRSDMRQLAASLKDAAQ